jgi:hypothetical protein
MVSHTAFLTFARRLAARGRKPGETPALDPAEHEADAVAAEFLEADAGPDAAAPDAEPAV